MRIAEIDYDLEIGGIKMLLTVSYAIEFNVISPRGAETPILETVGRPESIQTMVGGMPFAVVKWEDVRKDYPLYDWIRARANEITPEACGYTTQEALKEAIEDEFETAYLRTQTGIPL
jgi:hypothetical protein